MKIHFDSPVENIFYFIIFINNRLNNLFNCWQVQNECRYFVTILCTISNYNNKYNHKLFSFKYQIELVTCITAFGSLVLKVMRINQIKTINVLIF